MKRAKAYRTIDVTELQPGMIIMASSTTPVFVVSVEGFDSWPDKEKLKQVGKVGLRRVRGLFLSASGLHQGYLRLSADKKRFRLFSPGQGNFEGGTFRVPINA